MGNQKKRRTSAGNFLIPVSLVNSPNESVLESADNTEYVNAHPISQMDTIQNLPQQPIANQTSNQQVQYGGMDTLSQLIMSLNANPYIIGIMMLFLNLGGRFLALELTKKQEEFLQQRWVRPLLFFTVIFIATRNLAAAFWITVFFFFFIWVAANEHSPFCMIPSWCGDTSNTESDTYINNIKKLLGKIQ
jgi:hypothetical protein